MVMTSSLAPERLRWLAGSGATSRIGHWSFLIGCAAIYAALTLVVPPNFPLLEPDSHGYVAFSNNRTAIYPAFLALCRAIGLDLEQTTYVQLAIFCLALLFLISAFLRAGASRWMAAGFVLLLGLNAYFSSFQRTILTESLAFATTAVLLAFFIDYLRTGRVMFLALAGLFIGIGIGIRPAGLFLVPMLFVAAYLNWRQRDVGKSLFLAALLVPVTVGPVAELLMHRAVHDQRQSIMPYVMMGNAAMLARPDTVYTGPHAEALNHFGKSLAETYAPVHTFLDGVPSLIATPLLTAGYEAVAQFQVLSHEIDEWSRTARVSPHDIRNELGKQAILGNLPGYVRLTLIHYIGQWSITALTVPSVAQVVNDYVRTYPKAPLDDKIGAIVLHPPAALRSVVVYPAFILAGAATFLLSFALLYFLARPVRGAPGRGLHLMLACFFAAMAHVDMLLISLINVSTPRFLMAVYPAILLSGLFLLLAVLPPGRHGTIDRPVGGC
jgi:hypothetical protein